MKKAELIDAVASKSELTKQDTKKAVDGLFETTSKTLITNISEATFYRRWREYQKTKNTSNIVE